MKAHWERSDTSSVTLTQEEQKAIKQLEKWSKKAPKTLSLFGWSGRLVILKSGDDGRDCVVGDNFDIIGDGGDATPDEIDQDPDITYE